MLGRRAGDVAEGTGLGSEVSGCGPWTRCDGAVGSRMWVVGSCRLGTNAGTSDEALVWFTFPHRGL